MFKFVHHLFDEFRYLNLPYSTGLCNNINDELFQVSQKVIHSVPNICIYCNASQS